MKLQFDPNQQFQLDAVAAVVDLFQEQPQAVAEFSPVQSSSWGSLIAQQEGAIIASGNQLLLDEVRLRKNLRVIQNRNDVDVADVNSPVEGWDLVDPVDNRPRLCPHFSVEMETGTGKTYVYLRTIFELAKRYEFSKFIIVVPSVAIREGVVKNLQITADHFRALYNNLPFEWFVYDGRRLDKLRHFAVTTVPQVMVINIDAFRRNFTGTEDEQRGNLIYKETDKLGRQPIEYAQHTRPIVIIDEPQSVDSTERAQEAIKALNPLFTLRYSATHRNVYNLVYKLDPVRAFEMRLVKQIVVASSRLEAVASDAFVRVESITHKPTIRARALINAEGAHGTKQKPVSLKQGSDLHFLSGERAEYENGYSVVEINAESGSEYIRFSNGRTLRLGEEVGGLRDDAWRVQIRQTLKRHLEKELQVAGRGIKVLSLFFIDRVANYREYDEERNPVKGKFAKAFEEELIAIANDARFSSLPWLREPPDRLHNGYFAQDSKGTFKESREGRDTQGDDHAYGLIMREKERLLSIDEPLRFIFSHSALREGWDNPNVFQICTLNETKSAMKKRQEIGRGLRLPVDQKGERVFDDSINKLYVMANESYEDFAKALQTEYEEDCGVTFGKVPLRALAGLTLPVDGIETPLSQENATGIREALVKQGLLDSEGRLQPAFDPNKIGFRLELPEGLQDLVPAVTDLLASYQIERHIRREQDEGRNKLKKEVLLSPEFQALWDRIKHKTTYRVEFTTETLLQRAFDALRRMGDIDSMRIRVITGQVGVTRTGVKGDVIGVSDEQISHAGRPVPDLLAFLQNETDLTRATLAKILQDSGRLPDFFRNPQRFLDMAAEALKNEISRLLVDGIKYERLDGSGPDVEWEQVLFKHEELVSYLNSVQVRQSIYDYVPYDSEVERKFAKDLDAREDIKLFVKLPRKFEIDTPVGRYNPDWAIVKRESETVYLVRETKGTKDFLKLRSQEADKVRCGKKHFEALNVSFAVVTRADEV